jgi:hypothetical protein
MPQQYLYRKFCQDFIFKNNILGNFLFHRVKIPQRHRPADQETDKSQIASGDGTARAPQEGCTGLLPELFQVFSYRLPD